ncbi:MAG TPA: hypothetical protein PKI11_02385 [Candidatus Hydrogenedentes bacterium]|nr:hypothetical protein [Candidatus Hydrogenedentota bacterium]
MAFGDIGGVVTELIVTCTTPAEGDVAINKGDAVKLAGDYTVTNATDAEDVVFGQAMADASENGVAIPVKVRGVCAFAYTGSAPDVNGAAGVAASATAGAVKAPASGNGKGINLKVDTAAATVHVLL